jgi:calnexin
MKLSYIFLVLFAVTLAHDHHHDHDHHDHDHHDHDHHDHQAHDHQDHEKPTEVVIPNNSPNHPEIPQSLLEKLDFLETFQGGVKSLEKGWVASKNDRYFEHEWTVGITFGKKEDKTDSHEPGFKDDQSLAVEMKHKHYGLTHVLTKPFDNTNNTLVFQYEVRIHDGIGCSGAYAKLLLQQPKFDPLLLEEATPYVIMFGPDRCGSTNKVHFIVRQRQPGTDKWDEKHMSKMVAAKTQDSLTHLYTLIIRADQSFSVQIDGREENYGSLLNPGDFTPSFGAPKEIDDPTDFKPKDWVDLEKIPDPSAVKPADWDEDAPATFADPDAKKPEDWNDEDDGEWLPPKIPNPEYKGKWKAPIITNPEFKGEWKAKKIPNPSFFVDEHPANLAPISAVSFEILANDRGIAFDNILLTHNEEAAKEYSTLTFIKKQSLEKARAETIRRAKAKQERIRALNDDGPYGFMIYYWGEMLDYVNLNFYPVIISMTIGILSISYFCCFRFSSSGSRTRAPVEDDEEEEEEEEDSKPTKSTQQAKPPSVPKSSSSSKKTEEKPSKEEADTSD